MHPRRHSNVCPVAVLARAAGQPPRPPLAVPRTGILVAGSPECLMAPSGAAPSEPRGLLSSICQKQHGCCSLAPTDVLAPQWDEAPVGGRSGRGCGCGKSRRRRRRKKKEAGRLVHHLTLPPAVPYWPLRRGRPIHITLHTSVPFPPLTSPRHSAVAWLDRRRLDAGQKRLAYAIPVPKSNASRLLLVPPLPPDTPPPPPPPPSFPLFCPPFSRGEKRKEREKERKEKRTDTVTFPDLNSL
ncbi:hypothetical protein CDD83_2854 [Cordyceps sp. RAO-2017]|nr:hypothetical protein CDD83_2854 [Cordyceps sp. RAO-2017]